MELLQGKSLYQHLQDGRVFSDEEIIEVGKQLSRGLSAAHAGGIVHRDIKPGNIWIEEPSGRVKILDFGLAVAGEGNDRFARKGSVVGSPGYLAPEQARDDALDERTDLYSLGVVLYQLCTGQLPSVATTMPGQLLAILVHEPTPISELNPDVKSELADVIHCLLSKEPGDRPDNANHLEAMLEYAAQAPVEEPLVDDDEVEQLELLRDDDDQQLLFDDDAIADDVTVQAPKPVVSVQPQSKASRSTKKSRRAEEKSQRATGTVKSTEKSTRDNDDDEDATSTQTKSRLLWIVAAISTLIAIGVAGFLISRPKVRSNAPLAGQGDSRSRETFKVIPETLKPLQFASVSVNSKKVKVGSALQFKVTIKNEAADETSDPRVINAQARDIAALATFAKQGKAKDQLIAHRKMRPQDIPFAGTEAPFMVTFWTKKLSAGRCKVIFRLQSPDGETVSETSQQITIQK